MDYSKRNDDITRSSAFMRAQINFSYFMSGNNVFAFQKDMTEEQKNEKDNYKNVVNELLNDIKLINEMLG